MTSLEELGRYAWSGHSAIMGLAEYAWQDKEYVLQQFGRTVGSARVKYLEFVQDQMHMGRQPELTGSGLVRYAGGWSEVLSMRKRGNRQFGDERILGGGEFVEDALGEIGAAQKEMLPMRMRIADAEELLKSIVIKVD